MYATRWLFSLSQLLRPGGRTFHVGGGDEPVGSYDFVAVAGCPGDGHDSSVGLDACLRLLGRNGILAIQTLAERDRTSVEVSTSEGRHDVLSGYLEGELGLHVVRRHMRQGTTWMSLAFATRDIGDVAELSEVVDRVFTTNWAGATPVERRLNFELHVLAFGRSTASDIAAIEALDSSDLPPAVLRRLAALWTRDVGIASESERRSAMLRSETERLASELSALRVRFETLAIDAATNAVALAQELATRRNEVGSEQIGPSSDAADDPDLPPLSDGPGEHVDAESPRPAEPADDDREIGRDRGSTPADDDRDPSGDSPLVSIIVTSFNYGRFLDDAVESALAQTYPAIEVILVEGGSSDSASRLHAAAMDRTRVRVLMQGGPHRAGANRNFGISQAKGKYICCLDADDKLHPTYIEKAVYLLERARFDVVSTSQQSFGNETGLYRIAERPHLDELMIDNKVLTCAVHRRTHWAEVGGFRDSDISTEGHLHEDWEYWVRLGTLGVRFYNMSGEGLFLYRVHGSNISRGEHVLAPDRQRAIIASLNVDRITPDAIAKSLKAHDEIPFARPDDRRAIRAGDAGRRAMSGRMTILLALPYFALGGAERLLSAIVGHLVSRGFRLVILTSIPKSEQLGDTTAWFSQHTDHIYQLPLFLPRELWEDFLLDVVRKKDVRLIWIAGSAFLYDNLRALRTTFPDVVVADLLFNLKGHVDNNRRHRDRIDLTLVESQVVRDGLLALGERPDRVRVVASGVDLDRLNPALRTLDLRRTLGVDDMQIMVSYCGRWSPEKAPLNFIAMARKSPPAWPVKFVMTGAGPLAAEIERAIAEAAFPPGRFTLMGDVSDSSPIIASSDLLVIPSILDGRPMVALEAMALGTPVIASRVGDLPNLVHDGVTGWLCEPDDVDGLSRALSTAVADRERLSTMRQAARSFALENLDEHRMVDEYERALIDLQSAGSAADPAAADTVVAPPARS